MPISETDLTHLTRCVDLAEQALEAGDQPFGSVLVDHSGAVRFEDHNRVSGGDHTRHPEFTIARWAATNLSPADRAAATVYTSGEHCPMCAAAHAWVGLGRIVYAGSTAQLTEWRAGVPSGPVAPLPIQAVAPDVPVDGPALQLADRLRDLHRRYADRADQTESGDRRVSSRHPVGPGWAEVDAFLAEHLVHEPPAATSARTATDDAGLPPIEVTPAYGKLLAILCRIAGANRVLEFGTLGGYSTIWFAEAVGEGGHLTTLEIEQAHADLAAANLATAGLEDRVDIIVGPAAESVRELIAGGAAPYDLVFIDADKPSNPTYLAAAVELAKPGTVIVVDNIVRGGAILDATSADENAQGARAVIEAIGEHPRLRATGIQTVGAKGWDGFAIAVVDG